VGSKSRAIHLTTTCLCFSVIICYVLRHIYWRNAFPLYDCDYNSVLEAIEKMEKNLPGFFYAGNNKDGLAVGNVIASGSRAADLAISYLESHTKHNNSH